MVKSGNCRMRHILLHYIYKYCFSLFYICAAKNHTFSMAYLCETLTNIFTHIDSTSCMEYMPDVEDVDSNHLAACIAPRANNNLSIAE